MKCLNLKYYENNVTTETPTTVVDLTNFKMVTISDILLKIQDRKAAVFRISVFSPILTCD